MSSIKIEDETTVVSKKITMSLEDYNTLGTYLLELRRAIAISNCPPSSALYPLSKMIHDLGFRESVNFNG